MEPIDLSPVQTVLNADPAYLEPELADIYDDIARDYAYYGDADDEEMATFWAQEALYDVRRFWGQHEADIGKPWEYVRNQATRY